MNGTACPGYGDVDTSIVESGINNQMVPVYQPLLDLYANYNNGQGFNK